MGRMTSHILWKIKFMFETTNQQWYLLNGHEKQEKLMIHHPGWNEILVFPLSNPIFFLPNPLVAESKPQLFAGTKS